ncbi:MAG: c-type cytochrome [Gammaproteobacteria bacterium]|nr:c-type cytochrome [Chromatiales bacterium]MYA30184.1 c-type cytochrome [Gammaproteobacteria bacterium]MYE48005.1 c-type cytochrome [Gammaproteobacteria bacterium]MYF67372.1 c-type cytochrome [Gammaproteobacteria bacterium]MYK36805.1 c-type cytochrome [Gammaproteobacteria bacterium]
MNTAMRKNTFGASVLCAALFLGFAVLPSTFAADDAAPAGEAVTAEPPDPRLVARGKRLYVFCQACHATEEVQGSKIGPNLAGIMDRQVAILEDTLYSDALKQQDFVWDDEKMDIWLLRPADLVPGTSMGFVGLPQKQNREAIIAYLKTL